MEALEITLKVIFWIGVSVCALLVACWLDDELKDLFK
jgi:hypothetical protein